MLRRLVQEWTHSAPTRGPASESNLSILFLDLFKAFDGVPRASLFALLPHNLGVPDHIVNMLEVIYQDMSTQVCGPNGFLSDPIPMATGVRQGSVEGPLLFLLYYTFVLRLWHQRCSARLHREAGIEWLSSEDGTLREPRKVRKMATRTHRVTNSVFADDTALISSNWDEFQIMASEMATCLQDLGCDLNLLKTEWLEVPSFSPRRDQAPLPGCRILRINGMEIAKCGVFRYFGSMLSEQDAGSTVDISRRCGLAHAAFGKLRHVWTPTVRYSTKARLLLACVTPVLLYGSETWSLSHKQSRKLHNTWMSCVRRALGIRQPAMTQDRITNQDMLSRLGVPSIHTLLAQRIARWLGHVARMNPTRFPHGFLFGTLANRSFPSASSVGSSGLRFRCRAHGTVRTMSLAWTPPGRAKPRIDMHGTGWCLKSTCLPWGGLLQRGPLQLVFVQLLNPCPIISVVPFVLL